MQYALSALFFWLVTTTASAAVTATAPVADLSATATLDFASTNATLCSTDLTITVTGAAVGNACMVGAPNGSVNAGSQFTCWVSSANTVTVRHCNISAGANDPASGTFRVDVFQQ